MQKNENIVDRLRQAAGCKTDADLVTLLGSKPQTVSSWRSRGRVPQRIVTQIADSCGVSADWLLLGRGDPGGGQSVCALQIDGAHEEAGPVGLGVAEPSGIAALPSPLVAAQGVVDPRLEALVDWLRALWAGASEEERAWLVVELRMLRGRLGNP